MLLSPSWYEDALSRLLEFGTCHLPTTGDMSGALSIMPRNSIPTGDVSDLVARYIPGGKGGTPGGGSSVLGPSVTSTSTATTSGVVLIENVKDGGEL